VVAHNFFRVFRAPSARLRAAPPGARTGPEISTHTKKAEAAATAATMADRYRSAQSPRDSEMPGEFGDERFRKLVQETSKGLSSFNQVTRGIAQKMSLFGTPQDSRANHAQIKELTEKGNKLVAKINRRLQELNRGAKGPSGRARRTQVNKLSADFKNQVRVFEETCERLLESERQSVEFIRRSSQSFKGGDTHQTRGGAEFTNYSEDQIYAQANVVVYDEDGAWFIVYRCNLGDKPLMN